MAEALFYQANAARDLDRAEAICVTFAAFCSTNAWVLASRLPEVRPSLGSVAQTTDWLCRNRCTAGAWHCAFNVRTDLRSCLHTTPPRLLQSPSPYCEAVYLFNGDVIDSAIVMTVLTLQVLCRAAPCWRAYYGAQRCLPLQTTCRCAQTATNLAAMVCLRAVCNDFLN